MRMRELRVEACSAWAALAQLASNFLYCVRLTAGFIHIHRCRSLRGNTLKCGLHGAQLEPKKCCQHEY